MLETFRQRANNAIDHFLKKYRLTKIKLLLIFLGFVALIVLLDGINKPHLSPFHEKMALDYPCNIYMDEHGGVICDRQHTRLIILNEKQEVKDMISLKSSGSLINWVGDVTVYRDLIYVLGGVYTNQGMYLESESVVVYNLSGEFQKELYKYEYDAEDMETCPGLLTLWVKDDKLNIAGQNDRQFTIQSCDLSGKVVEEKKYVCQERILSAQMIGNDLVAFDRQNRPYYPDDQRGELKAVKGSEEDIGILKSLDINRDALEKLSTVPSDSFMRFQFSESQQIENIFCFSEKENKIYRYNFSKNELDEITTLNISSLWTLKNLFFWLFTAYTVIILIYVAYWLLLIKKQFWEWQRFLAMVLIVLLVTGIYTYYSSNRIQEIYTTEISMLDKQVSAELQNGYRDVLEGVAQKGIMTYCESEQGQTRLGELENFLSNMSQACGKEVGFFIDVLVSNSNGDIIMLADSQRIAAIGQSVNMTLPDFTDNTEVVSRTADADGKYLLEQSRIDGQNGGISFIVESGCYEGNLSKQLRTEAVNLLVNLLALLITLWISLSVLRDIPRSIKKFREKSSCGDPDASVSLTGIFTFLQQMISLLDVVMLVYVVQSMLLPAEQQYLSVITAIVIAIFNTGRFLGNGLVHQLRIRIGERKMSITASIGGFSSFLMMAFAVWTTNFGIFLLGKCLSGIFIDSHLLVLSRGLPLRSKNEKTRIGGLNKNQQAYTAGAILSVLLAGYLSQYIAYSAVYLLGAALCVPLFFISLYVLKPGVNIEARKRFMEVKKQSKGLIGMIKRMPLTFYRTPEALAFILFYTFPFVLTNGYQTYLFPLFSAGAGISALLLSNITVFGQAIAYLTNKPVMEITGNWDRLRTMIGSMAILCGCFICFYFSPNIWWAIIVLFIQFILFRIPRVGTTVHLSELAEKEGYEPRTVQPTYYSIENMFTSIQAPILKSFISLGVNYAGAALGVFCSLFLGIFAVLTGKRRKNEAMMIQVNDE